MIDLIKQFEAVPAAYPDAPAGLSTEAAALDAAMIWHRIEAYTAHRFTEREVVWTLLGSAEDQFHSRLTPVVSREAHFWNDEWESVTLLDGPLGICLPFDGTYRITAQVGAGDVPAAVSEAFRRLAEYLAPGEEHPGASGYKTGMASIDVEVTRSATWVARAMQLSGAGDLLRPYRRA
ncbi:MAG: hypothetical protein K8F59_02570 [Rhodobacteraceae bacterium]|nr:hypothetical protein [Paracoccaceae bacterium]